MWIYQSNRCKCGDTGAGGVGFVYTSILVWKS